LHLPASEVLFTSSLLENLGELAMAVYLPEVFTKITNTITFTGLPHEEAHLRITSMTPHEVTEIVVQALGLPGDLLVPVPSAECQSAWTPAQRREAIIHLTNVCATNLFSIESPQIVSQFTTLMDRIASIT